MGPLIHTGGLAAEPSPAVVTEGLGSASVNAGEVKIHIHNYSGPRWELGEETLGPQRTSTHTHPNTPPPMARIHAHCPARAGSLRGWEPCTEVWAAEALGTQAAGSAPLPSQKELEGEFPRRALHVATR